MTTGVSHFGGRVVEDCHKVGACGSGSHEPHIWPSWAHKGLLYVEIMINRNFARSSKFGAATACVMLLPVSACGSDDPGDATEAGVSATSETAEATGSTTPETTEAAGNSTVDSAAGCEDVAAPFVTRGSANADLDEPAVEASCDGDSLVVTSNDIPGYTYIETSPGNPRTHRTTP